MGVGITSPAGSFVQFAVGGPPTTEHCVYGELGYYLPVVEEDDVHFQFTLTAETEEEADEICAVANSLLSVGLSDTCAYEAQLINFSEKPEWFRLNSTKILFNWKHGFPGFAGVVNVGECFKIIIAITIDGEEYLFCSNTFQRIPADCFTAVLEYGNEENAFGFNYCAGGEDEDAAADCDATYITFPPGTETLEIPYTAALQAKYGDAPTIQTWIYDEDGNLVNMGVTAKLDGFPPTQLEFDFGGPAAGIIVIK